MSSVKIIICIVLAGYLIGSVPFGYIVGKVKHIDIRKYGSGNSGTTNAFRTVGRIGGILTFLGDFLKAFIPILLIKYVLFPDMDYTMLIELIFGFSCVLGHNFPVWLKFKGGKGIAVTAGVCAAYDFLIIPVGVAVFAAIVLITKYVSLGSLVISLIVPIWVFIRTDHSNPYFIYMLIVASLFTISAYIRHRKNIVRLIHGEENKIGQRVKIDKPEDNNE